MEAILEDLCRVCGWQTIQSTSSKKTILVHVSVCAVFSEKLLLAFRIATSKDCPEIHPPNDLYLVLLNNGACDNDQSSFKEDTLQVWSETLGQVNALYEGKSTGVCLLLAQVYILQPRLWNRL